MTINSKYRQQLKAQAHSLKPIVTIGNHGLTEAVQLEIERALVDHELIKIRIQGNDRVLRRQMIDEICQTRQAELVQSIGHICAIYRKNPD